MSQPIGIPTGAYHLHRVPTPLDPEPKGPVYDGGVLVSDGLPLVEPSAPRAEKPDAGSGAVTSKSATAAVTTPAELRDKYLFIELKNELSAFLTLPERASRGDLLIDCHHVRSKRGLVPPVGEETISKLMEDKRFRAPVLSLTDIRICGTVQGSAGMTKDSMDRFLSQRRIRWASIEDLVSACAIHYAVTGRHLILPGRVVRAADGVVRTTRNLGQLQVMLDSVNQFDNDPMLVAAGVVPLGERSVGARQRGGVLERLARRIGL